MYPDGSPVKGPKALCELQGYVFDAKRRLAEAAEYFGDATRAAQLRQEAEAFRHDLKSGSGARRSTVMPMRWMETNRR